MPVLGENMSKFSETSEFLCAIAAIHFLIKKLKFKQCMLFLERFKWKFLVTVKMKQLQILFTKHKLAGS